MGRYKKRISRIATIAMLFAFLVGNSNMVYAMGATQVGYASKYITVKRVLCSQNFLCLGNAWVSYP